MKNSALSALKGFTLIELLVVISIIGILATLIFANFAGVRERARDAARKSDINQIQKGLEIYKSSQTPIQYPAALSSLSPNYMSKVPHDPKCTYNPSTGLWDCGTWPDYSYTRDPGSTGDNLTYELMACLENASDQQRDATQNTDCSMASFTRREP